MFDSQIRVDLECITGQRKPSAGEGLRDVLARLDELTSREDLPERLHHYLSRRSYVKALEWLDNPDMPHRT